MRQWSVRPFSADTDIDGVLKLLSSVAGFDGGVCARSRAWLDAALAAAVYDQGSAWRVALAGNGAIVGVMTVSFIGTKRTHIVVAVNPAWRRQGVGRGLLDDAPKERRLMVESRAHSSGATGLMLASGFEERHRLARMRRSIGAMRPAEFPSWASIDEDRHADPERYRAVCLLAFGEDSESDLGLIRAELERPGTRILYLQTPQGDQGVALVAASDRSKKAEMDRNGASTIGVLERVGLARSCRGKGLSRPLIRAGLIGLAEDGYREFETVADKRRPQAVDLYAQEGFSEVDEEVLWIRRDDG